MANPSKAKGDRAELAAVAYLTQAAPHLVSVHRAQRKLGAGRADDTGDLWVFHDVAIQVRAYDLARIGTAIRTAAVDAAQQATNAGVPYALGMVPFPRARAGSVRWLACATRWPTAPVREPLPFELVGRALTWLRDDIGPYGFDPRPRRARIAALTSTEGPALVAPIEAWLDAFATARVTPGMAAA